MLGKMKEITTKERRKNNRNMHKNVSYWEQNVFIDNIDFAIIGSGIVGLNAALARKTKYPNEKVVVIERGPLPSGASTKNAGFACFGSISELVDDMEQNGKQAMLNLVRKRWDGLQRLRGKLGDQQIDYKEHGGYELFYEHTEDYTKYKDYIPFFNNCLSDIIGTKEVFVEVADATRFGFGSAIRLIKNTAEGQLHPGKMIQSLLQKATKAGVQIYSGLTIDHIEEIGNQVHLSSTLFDLTTKKLLIATNGFTNRLLPNLDLQPARNQVIITKPISGLQLKGCFHYDKGYYYFRNVGDRVLLGGARNQSPLAETTDFFGTTETIQNALMGFMKSTILPTTTIEIDYKWSGILGVGASKSPIVKKISDRIGMSIRLGGMGVAIGTLVGEEGANLFD